LIEANALPLSQTANQSIEARQERVDPGRRQTVRLSIEDVAARSHGRRSQRRRTCAEMFFFIAKRFRLRELYRLAACAGTKNMKNNRDSLFFEQYIKLI